MKVSLKTIAALLTILAVGVSAIIAINRYFAKESDMSEVAETLVIQRADADVRYQEQKIERIKTRVTFQRRPEPMSPGEEDILEEEEKRLGELEQEREQKQQYYRSRK